MGGPGKTLPLSRNDDLQHGAVQKEWQGSTSRSSWYLTGMEQRWRKALRL